MQQLHVYHVLIGTTHTALSASLLFISTSKSDIIEIQTNKKNNCFVKLKRVHVRTVNHKNSELLFLSRHFPTCIFIYLCFVRYLCGYATLAGDGDADQL